MSLNPFPIVFVEGRRLLLRRLKRPPGVHAWAHDPSEYYNGNRLFSHDLTGSSDVRLIFFIG